jgi:hypothetical protein
MPPACRNWLQVVVATLLGAVLISACGTVEHVRAGGTLNVAVTEFRINPRTATASPGLLRLVVRNDGRLTHDLVVDLDGKEQGATPSIPPGGEATLLLFVSPGQYLMSSRILEDADLGARATLNVS